MFRLIKFAKFLCWNSRDSWSDPTTMEDGLSLHEKRRHRGRYSRQKNRPVDGVIIVI